MGKDYKELSVLAQTLTASSHPTFNRLPQFAQPSLEEMVSAFNQHQLLRLRDRRHQSLQLRPRTKLIARAADEQLRLGTVAQEVERIHARRFRIGGDRNRRNAHSNQRLDAIIWTCRSQPDRRAEGESCEQQWQVELSVQPVESGANIFNFPVAVIVFAVAESSAAKIEAQHGKTKTVQRLHGMEHNLVMQRSPKQRMRVANDCRMSRILRTGVQQRFESSRWAFKKKRSDG